MKVSIEHLNVSNFYKAVTYDVILLNCNTVGQCYQFSLQKYLICVQVAYLTLIYNNCNKFV